MSLDGQIVVLTSDDAVSWHKHSVLSWQGGDLRDPKLSVTPSNTVIMTAGIRWAVPNTSVSRLYSVGWQLANNDQAWSSPIIDKTSEGTWRWATTWHKGYAYSVGYGGHDQQGCLYRSDDGLHWEAWLKPFFTDATVFSNESSLVSEGENLVCLTRRDAAGGAKAILGCTTDELKAWHWKTLPIAIGGPKLLKLSNGEWVMAVRRINYKRGLAKTRLYKLNPHSGKTKHWRTLPSGGDTSYAGMVEKNGQLYISYYSSHQDSQTNIYLVTLPLKVKKRSLKFAK
ncbi:sialidase family protein [Thiosulfativibrio zosterae]|uniref:Sialidase domain-containing protein n=1 Tax=Thiosulfativibrio zosterae TaxID=2675053 RepID=A0A6F8PM00_9GAMM|nr:sialidase family protein [Thiosulfativibrio zosterae]BBP43084.1 hypothetical protein THMIRHAT_08300 [Thiosulfativibrio zosterae]